MRKLLVFQHVPLEPLGTLNAQFKQAGFRIRYVNFDRQPDARVDVSRYHGLVVLGGPMAANQTDRHPHLGYECEVIDRAVDLGLPVLGICLGAQLIAVTFGGKCLRQAAPEYGWVGVEPTELGRQDPLVRHFGASEPIFQWHSDTFTLPRTAVHLAKSDTCAYQAFSLGDHVYGFQFHLEADRGLISRWLKAPQHSGELAEHKLDYRQTMSACDRLLPRATELGEAVFGEFIERFYAFRRRRAHLSR
ncbi:MAG: gamma-glutamyl-gamma-aminobutyrate hydrolase family protein [Gammaproteobacteria bacterium]|nr:gamma-glutamyl-gamma-aminobutyrate hydrolase family protein [Gammaproteobacteria bacterium]